MKPNAGSAIPVHDCISALLMSLLIQLLLNCSVQMSGFSLPPPICPAPLSLSLALFLSVFDVSGVRIKSSSQRKNCALSIISKTMT